MLAIYREFEYGLWPRTSERANRLAMLPRIASARNADIAGATCPVWSASPTWSNAAVSGLKLKTRRKPAIEAGRLSA
jgi:hypothetical protein